MEVQGGNDNETAPTNDLGVEVTVTKKHLEEAEGDPALARYIAQQERLKSLRPD